MPRGQRLGMRGNVRAAGRAVNLTPVWAGNNVKFAMPIYEYRCTKCRKRFSQQQAIEEHDRRRPACPKCKSRAVEQVFSPFFAKTVRKS
jgi:putative FmdB family regulatory protein